MDSRPADDLTRFVAPVRRHRLDAENELRAGRKETHWMWFLFPQLRELGRSPTAAHFGLVDLDEAVRYLAHAELGASFASLVLVVRGQVVTRAARLEQLFGDPDDLKLVSSLTLFGAAAERLGKSELSGLCREVLLAAVAQGYARCALTEGHVAGRARA